MVMLGPPPFSLTTSPILNSAMHQLYSRDNCADTRIKILAFSALSCLDEDFLHIGTNGLACLGFGRP
jgi:hypothetical protein